MEIPSKRNFWLIIVPDQFKTTILQQLHGICPSSHLGSTKTTSWARQRFYWVNMGCDIQDLFRTCDNYTAKKGPAQRIWAPLQLHQVGAPLEWVAINILGPLPCTHQGNTYILVVMDGFTKWPEAYALPNQEAGVVALAFVEGFVCRHSIAEELHTDQCRNFESQLLKEVCSLSSIRKTRTTP